MPKYDEKTWNDGIKEQTRNCYDYALNRKPLDEPGSDTDRNRDPGARARRKRPKAWTCDNVIDEAEADGVDMGEKSKRTITLATECGSDCYKVALYVAPATELVPEGDYHWARQDDDGRWSHKFGNQEIMREDDKGKEFTADPEKAFFERPMDRQPYGFCRYGCVCTDKLVSGFPLVDAPAYAVVRLKEPATLVSDSIDLCLPPGRLSLVYADRDRANEEVVEVELVLYSGAENPTLELTDDDLEQLLGNLAKLSPADRPDAPIRGGFLISSPPGTSDLPRFVRVVDGRIGLTGNCTTWFQDENDSAAKLRELFLERAPQELRLDVQGAVKAALRPRKRRRGPSD